MQIDEQREGRRTRLCISGELTIYEVGPLQRALQSSLGASDSLELDLSAVTELDTAGLQQLLIVRREATALGKSLRIEHGEATREVLALCRLEAYFEEPSPGTRLAPSTNGDARRT